MSALQSLRAWSNPAWPSTATYGALAHFGVRRSALWVVLGVGSQLAILVPTGGYAVAAFVVGTLVAAAVGYFAGVAVAFDDRDRAVLAAVASGGVLLGTGAVMRALRPGDWQGLGVVLVAFAAACSLASGVGGYTAAERATWQTED